MLMEFGLVDLLHHVWKCLRFLQMKTWSQVRQGRFLREICDYILGIDRRRFEMVGIKDVRNYSSDHFALRARLFQRLKRCHGRYLRGHHDLPLYLTMPEDFSLTDKKLQDWNAPTPPHPTDLTPPPPLNIRNLEPDY